MHINDSNRSSSGLGIQKSTTAADAATTVSTALDTDAQQPKPTNVCSSFLTGGTRIFELRLHRPSQPRYHSGATDQQLIPPRERFWGFAPPRDIFSLIARIIVQTSDLGERALSGMAWHGSSSGSVYAMERRDMNRVFDRQKGGMHKHTEI